MEQGTCNSCLRAGVFPTAPSHPTAFSRFRLSLDALCTRKETCLFLSQPFLFTHLCACTATTGRLLEGGGLSPWFSTGSLWPCWSLWVSELLFHLNWKALEPLLLLGLCAPLLAVPRSPRLPEGGWAMEEVSFSSTS